MSNRDDDVDDFILFLSLKYGQDLALLCSMITFAKLISNSFEEQILNLLHLYPLLA